VADPFSGYVESKWNDARSLSTESIAIAKDAMAAILGATNTHIAAAGLALDGFNFPPSGVGDVNVEFQLPAQPTLPSLELGDLKNDARYAGSNGISYQFPGAPVNFVGVLPALVPKETPNAISVAAPGDAPSLTIPAYPDAPDLEFPELPSKITIPLPTVRVPSLSGVDGILAGLLANKPTAPVTTLPADAFLDTFNTLRSNLGADLTPSLPLEEVLSWMLAGDSIGIPADVAQMLRDRAFAAEDRQAFQAESEAMSDWLARGFTLPGGALEAKLADVRQANRDKKAQLNRDLWLEEAKLEIEQLQKAVQAGIQYQGQLWDTKTKLWSVCGDLASQVLGTQIKVLEASLAVFKSQADVWQAEASVAKDHVQALIQTEMAKLEITKVEAEISKLFVEINTQDVNLYRAAMEGVNQVVTVYKTRVDAVNSQMQGESLKLEAFAKQVQAYSAAVGAYEAEWRGYAAAVQADNANVEGFKARVQAYSAQIDAYGKQVDAVRSEISSQVELEKLGLQAFQVELEAYKAELQKVSIETEAKAKIHDAQVRLFGTLVQAEEARVGSELKKVDQQLQQAQFAASIALKQADLDQTKAIELAKLAMEGESQVARVAAQIGGAALSAVGASVGLNSSVSDSTSHNYSYSMTP
jgi:hypothetical protein